MAFPTVVARTSYAAGGDTTSWAALSSVTVAVDELLVFVCSADGDPTLSTASSGWNKLGQRGNGSSPVAAIFYKIATGTSESLTITSSASENMSGILYRIDGADSISGSSSANAAAAANQDAPAHNPGTARDYLWITTLSTDANVVASAAPSGYTGLETKVAVGSFGASNSTAHRTNNASSEDPGTWTHDAESTALWTLAVWLAPTSIDYTLACDGGSFTETGGVCSFRLSFAAAAGSFTLSGGNLTPAATSTVALAGGAITLSGGAFTASWASAMALDGEAYALSGGDLALVRVIICGSGSFDLTGGDLAPLWPSTVALAGVSFDLAGGDMVSPLGFPLGSGTFEATGGAMTPTLAASLPLASGAHTLTGGAMMTGFALVLASGTLSLSGGTLSFAVSAPMAGGSFALDGGTLTAAPAFTLNLAGGAVTLTGADLTIIWLVPLVTPASRRAAAFNLGVRVAAAVNLGTRNAGARRDGNPS